MKGTEKDFLENYSRYPELARKVLEQMTADWEDVYMYPKDYRDAGNGVGGFIYYRDTEPFARRNMALIEDARTDFEVETGSVLSGNELYKSNKLNFLAWFALETIVDEIMRYKERGVK